MLHGAQIQSLQSLRLFTNYEGLAATVWDGFTRDDSAADLKRSIRPNLHTVLNAWLVCISNDVLHKHSMWKSILTQYPCINALLATLKQRPPAVSIPQNDHHTLVQEAFVLSNLKDTVCMFQTRELAHKISSCTFHCRQHFSWYGVRIYSRSSQIRAGYAILNRDQISAPPSCRIDSHMILIGNWGHILYSDQSFIASKVWRTPSRPVERREEKRMQPARRQLSSTGLPLLFLDLLELSHCLPLYAKAHLWP